MPEQDLTIRGIGQYCPGMLLVSKGLRSDLAQLDCEILDRGDYLCVRSPKEPEFYWGNLLVFSEPPATGDFERWQKLFVQEFGDTQTIRHQTFTWDDSSEAGEVLPFIEAGYHYEKSVVLSASAITSPRYPNREITIRLLVGDDGWQDLLECELDCREDTPEEGYEDFVRKRMTAKRLRVERGEGHWYGAYIGDRIVASLGIFRNDELARFQAVMTRPDARKRGICATLVHHVSELALTRPETSSLLLIADTDYHAGRIYESLGYRPTEELRGLCRWPDPLG